MGFNPTRIITLEFDEEEWADAVVKVRRSVTLGFRQRFQEARRQAQEGISDDSWLHMFFDELLVSWNVTDEEGNDIPPTLEGSEDVPADFIDACAMAWAAALGQVPAPLGTISTSGEPSPEESTRKAESSLDLESLMTPA